MKSVFEVGLALLWLFELCTFSSLASGELTLSPESLFHKINLDTLLAFYEIPAEIDKEKGTKLQKLEQRKTQLPNSNTSSNIHKPARQDLLHTIGLRIQEFGERFDSFKATSNKNSKYAELEKADKILSAISNDLLPHAKLILRGTSIPGLIVDLRSQFELCKIRIRDLHALQEHYSELPKDLTYRLEVNTKSMDEITSKIELLVKRLMDLVIEESKVKHVTSIGD